MKESALAVSTIVKISLKKHSYLQRLPIIIHNLIYPLAHILNLFSSKPYVINNFPIILLLLPYCYLQKLPLNLLHRLIKQYQGDSDENYYLLIFKVQAIMLVFLWIHFTISSLLFRAKNFPNFIFNHSNIKSHW